MIRNGSFLAQELRKNSKKEFDMDLADDLDTRKNEFGQAYLTRVFSWDGKQEKRPDLGDLGNFEHQFERMLANPELVEDQKRLEIKAQGWCVDWFEELFEDAWSVLAMREPFLVYFEDILSRHTGVDGRHPPLDVRLSVAKELLKLADPQSTVKNDPKPVERIAAEQILKFMSLSLAAAYNVKNQKQEGWRYLLTEAVSNEITKYIGLWSTEFLKTSNLTDAARTETEAFIKVFSDLKTKLANLSPDTTNLKNEENQIKASYEDLLKDKNYKQLLDLSFYDVDFVDVVKVKVRVGADTFDYSGKLPIINSGAVRYRVDNGTVDRFIDAPNWEKTFGAKTAIRFNADGTRKKP
jgi:hypothetical protein